MITVYLCNADDDGDFTMIKLQIHKAAIESIQYLGSRSIRLEGNDCTGPVCLVRMASGIEYFVNATPNELEARSA